MNRSSEAIWVTLSLDLYSVYSGYESVDARMEMRIECDNFDVEVTSDIFSVHCTCWFPYFLVAKLMELFLQAQREHVE